jgi:hypothetical protein
MEFGPIICGIAVHGSKLIYTAAGVGLGVAILYFKLFFKDWDDFKDAWSDFWRGLFRRQIAGRISFWIIISVGSAMLAFYQLPDWFPHLFGKS